MTKTTITADEATLRRVRIKAVKRRISVSRLVGLLLEGKFRDDDAYERAMADFFSRGPYLTLPVREDGRGWPAREGIRGRSGS